MFTAQPLARRIERAETGLLLEAGRAAGRRVPAAQLVVQEFLGGAAVYVETGSPFNKVVGLGFDGLPSAESLTALERQFADRQAPLQFEVSTLADPALARTLAGGASFRVEGGIAQLSGASTLPAHRRRGVQGALLRHRLAEAVRRGCDLAVVTTEPGSTSQQNAHKAGFVLLYARAVLVKSGH